MTVLKTFLLIWQDPHPLYISYEYISYENAYEDDIYRIKEINLMNYYDQSI